MIDALNYQPASRMAGIGVSEILARTARAAAVRQAGGVMVDLGAGEPAFDTPDHIKQAACQAIGAGETKYTVIDGSNLLKEAVLTKFKRDNNLAYERQNITCGAGAKQLLYNAFMATLDPGDEVIIPAPYWTSYADIIKIAGGIPVIVPCKQDQGFLLQPEQLARAITSRTRWLLINSPSNPSGAAYSRADLESFAEILRGHPDIWVMSDDIYEHILYDDFTFCTFAMAAPDLADRTLTINGVSKAYAMTGWRIGYGAGPVSLIRAMAAVQSQSTSCPSSISQAAAIAALTGPQDCVRQFTKSFRHRRDLILGFLADIPGLSCVAPNGTFYAYIDCAGIIGARTEAGAFISSDVDFADYLLDHGVAVVPGSCFGLSPYIRISFAAAEAELGAAFDRIRIACAALDLNHSHNQRIG